MCDIRHWIIQKTLSTGKLSTGALQYTISLTDNILPLTTRVRPSDIFVFDSLGFVKWQNLFFVRWELEYKVGSIMGGGRLSPLTLILRIRSRSSCTH